MIKEDYEYLEKYGDIPNDQLGRISYILGKRANNEKFNNEIVSSVKKIKKIKFTTLSFTMWKIVKPSQRPRVTTVMGYPRMYVPGAKAYGDWFEKFAIENKLPFIETPCFLDLVIYEKTPSNFNMKRKVLAELGFIRPWVRTGDYDNYAKSVSDAIQHGMLKDDYLVIEGSQKLYFSIKPHACVKIQYMNTFPEY